MTKKALHNYLTIVKYKLDIVFSFNDTLLSHVYMNAEMDKKCLSNNFLVNIVINPKLCLQLTIPSST